MPWVFRGLRNGVVTSRWPRRSDPYYDEFAAGVDVIGGADGARRALDEAQAVSRRLCPTDAIQVESGEVTLDRGRCVLCGRCVDAAPDVFAWTRGAGVARLRRQSLVVGDVAENDDALAALRETLARRVRRLRRSIHIRHVDAGSDGSVLALGDPARLEDVLEALHAGHAH